MVLVGVSNFKMKVVQRYCMVIGGFLCIKIVWYFVRVIYWDLDSLD